MSRFSFEQDENGPFLWMNITSGNEITRLRLDWESTSLFTHRDQDRHYDHVFCETKPSESDHYRAVGAFIWRQVLPDWDDLKNALITHDFTHIHSPYPSMADVEQYENSGLMPPQANFIRQDPTEPKVIEEAEDDNVVTQAIKDIDHELNWFLNDPHFYDRIKPRKDDGTAER